MLQRRSELPIDFYREPLESAWVSSNLQITKLLHDFVYGLVV